MKTFAELFKKYRLRAEFATLAEFGMALAEKKFIYEDSIFSHWQKGTRLPPTREVMLAVVVVFIGRDALFTVHEVNEFLESAGYGYLTEQETNVLQLSASPGHPFQVPSDGAYFAGREAIVRNIVDRITYGKVILLHGQPGVGKTALAIKLGHLLRSNFPDGVLWYKVDSSSVMDILLSIAHIFGEEIGMIKDVHVRASIVRTLLSKKQLLLILDNVTTQESLHLLIPDTTFCSVIISTQEKRIHIPVEYIDIHINTFTKAEVLELFEKVFSKAFVDRHVKEIATLGEKVGNLPLAVHIAARYMKQYGMLPGDYIKQLDRESIDLRTLIYEDTNLFRTIFLGFSTLEGKNKTVFISLGVFEGKDFGLDAVAFINRISLEQAEKCMQHLIAISFVELSNSKRYRIHPMIKIFARKQIRDHVIYLRAAEYYEGLLVAAEKKHSRKSLMSEVDTIIYIFKKCYELGYWDEIIILWNPIEKFLSDSNEIKKLRVLAQTIDTAPSINSLQMILTIYAGCLFIYWLVLQQSGLHISNWNYLFSFLYTFIPLIGGFVGIVRSKPWGGFETNIGKAIFFTSLGLFFWGIGNMTWAYYNFFQNVGVPYPSLADIGFFPGYCSWVISVIYLCRATGAKFALKHRRNKLFLLLIPFLIITSSYYFLLFIVKRTFMSDTPAKIFFDLAYPSLDIITLTLASIIFGLSVNFLGGKYRRSLYAILSGIACLYIADFVFSYTTSLNVFYNGHIGDLMFMLALYLLTWGNLSFYLTPKKRL